jgi:cysteine desulfurase family protein (TIGR01976 family)
MDNAGGTQVPFHVAESVRDYLLHSNVQHGGSYEISRNAAATVAEGRRVAADMMGADPGEIVFGSNMSTLFRMLALVLSEIWDPEDEVIVTQAEHEANVGAWDYLSQFGIVVRPWEIDTGSMTFDVSRLVDLISDKTRMVAVTHASNVLGSVFPVKEVLKLAKGCGAYLCVDGGQYVPHRRLDVKDLGADFYLFSSYKAFGSHLGVMYGKRDVLEGIPKWGHFFVEENAVPQKFELGTQNFEGIAGLVGLEKYFRAVGMSLNEPFPQVLDRAFEGIRKHETELTRDLLNYLATKRKVHIVGEADVRMIEDRLPIVAFLVDETDPQELVQEVDRARIGIRWGHFNSPRLLDALGMLEYKGVVRVSLAHYNTKAELDRLKKTLDPLIS